MLTETATSTRVWIFKRKKDWSCYLGQARTKIPKLVIYGRQDGINSLDYIEYIKVPRDRSPCCLRVLMAIQGKWEPNLFTTSLIEDAGHAPFLEKPQEFNQVLFDWVKKLI